MKKGILILSAAYLLCGAGVLSAQRSLSAYLNFASYQTRSGKPYFETYLSISANTLTLKKDSNGRYGGRVGVSVTFLQHDSELYEKNYSVMSPSWKDSSKRMDFIDVERYRLPKGKYDLIVRLMDEYNTTPKTVSVRQTIKAGYPDDSVRIADAEFLASYTPSANDGSRFKDGYELIPYIYDYYPQTINKISFYTEIYNTNRVAGKNKALLLRYYIRPESGDSILTEYVCTKVVNADTLIPLLGGFLIDELPTGNYRLTVCAIMGKQIIAHRVFSFTRTNKIMITNATSTSNFTTNMKKDSLVKYIHCLLPLAKVNDVDYVSSDSLGNLSRAELQSFFYGFWAARNPNDPRGEWDRYYQRVNEVQAEFGTNQLKGYQTDRGRIYLQNGPPNQRFSSNISPTSYPYEIWEYYRLADGQIDRKYVFYEPDVVTNNYVLLQSNAKGEVHNQQWQLMLNDRFGGANNVDQTNNPDAYGENALDEYNSPR